MIKVSKEIKSKIEEIVDGYIAGSCVSFDEALNRLDEDLEEMGVTMSLESLEELLIQAIADAELFCCENCSWWCHEHDRSEEGTYCSDCGGE